MDRVKPKVKPAGGCSMEFDLGGILDVDRGDEFFDICLRTDWPEDWDFTEIQSYGYDCVVFHTSYPIKGVAGVIHQLQKIVDQFDGEEDWWQE